MKHYSNVSKADAAKINRMVRKCMRHLKKKEYELDFPDYALDMATSCLVVRSTESTVSRAGKHTITINIGSWQIGNTVHTEYAAYKKDRVIGNIEVVDNDDHLWITVAHEVAHHVQYRYAPRVHRFKGTYKKPHGDCFQMLYRYLRRDLINPMIEAKRHS